jgi:hypothetical protein
MFHNSFKQIWKSLVNNKQTNLYNSTLFIGFKNTKDAKKK